MTKITISSILIGLKTPILHLFTCQVVIGQFVIGQFVIGQFNKPITFKVVETCTCSLAFVLLVSNYR